MRALYLLALAALPACAAEELGPALAADDECAAVGGGEGACSLVALQLRGDAKVLHVHGAARPYYVERPLVANEGNDLNVQGNQGRAGCEALCDQTPACKSFTLGVSGSDANKCYLKDKQVSFGDPTTSADWNRQNFKTYFKAPYVSGYSQRDLVASEGSELGVRGPGASATECGPVCDQTPNCRSFTYALTGNDAGKCFLKSGFVQANDASTATQYNLQNFMTYYSQKSGGGGGGSPSPPPAPPPPSPAPNPPPGAAPRLPLQTVAGSDFKAEDKCIWKALISTPSMCSDAAQKLGYGKSRPKVVKPEDASLPPGCFYAQGVKDVADGLYLNDFAIKSFVVMGSEKYYDHQENGIDMFCRKTYYAQAGRGKKCRPGKSIKDKQECEEASRLLKKGGVQEVDARAAMQQPIGCFESADQEYPGVWFNKGWNDFTTASGAGADKICADYIPRLR